MKKCKEGHYYCFQDSKCKPIPKGYRRGVGGYLRKEREDEKEDSKKNGNGNGNGNNGSNGSNGNGSGNGNGVSGGNGGGNGSGGVGESFETIQNSEGETTAVVVDIIGPTHMRPRLNGNGVWKGTHITEAGRIAFGGYKDGIIINPSGSRNKYGLPDNMKPDSGSTKETPLTPTHNRLLVMNTKKKDVKESSVALPFFLNTINKTNALKKALPLVTTGVGALGTMMQAKKKGKRILSRAEKKLFDKSQRDTDQRDDAIRSNPAEIDKQNKLVDKYSKKLKTPKEKNETQRFLRGIARGEIMQDEYIPERKMTEKEKKKDDRLKKKYDKSDMKKSMQDQYGKEEGKKVYFATIRRQAMEEELDKKDKPYIKKLVKNLRKGSKTHAKQADKLEKKIKD